MELTKELLHELFEYNNGTLFRKKTRAPNAVAGAEAGWERPGGYRAVRLNHRDYRVHHIIFMMFNGYLPRELDHINNNPTDNRIENLREVSSSQNKMNMRIRSDSGSGIKGVSWDKSRCQWAVRVQMNGKYVHRSRHDDLELAELVAMEARNLYHGEFANHG